MIFETLFSGSGGNCSYVRSGKTEILIDAGGSARRIECALREIGTGLSNISAIYITHEHSDHIAALPVVLKSRNIPVYATLESARLICSGPGGAPIREHIYTIRPENIYETGDFELIPFRTPHDSVMSVGYRICAQDGHTLGYATDTGHVTDTMRRFLSGCQSVVIESNHDVKMLKEGPYPAFLKARILSENGHLSNACCAEFACELVESGCQSIMLAHLSKENNTPETAYNASKSELERHGVQIGRDVRLAVAAENRICSIC